MAAVVLALGSLLASGGLSPASSGAEERQPALFVFLTTALRPYALEKALEKEMPGVAVTAFGRSSDFEDALRATPPDAVLALRPVLAAHSLRPTLQGYRGGVSTEAYVLVSVGQGLAMEALTDKIVGVVDLLGRKGTSDLVSQLFGASKPKIKRVVKPEDLLFLLQLKMADAIFASESTFEELKRGSELDLRAVKIKGADLGLPAVAFLNDMGRAKAGPRITGMSAELARQIGVGSWQPE